MTEAPPYEVPDDPGTSSGVTPELESDEHADESPSLEHDNADTINVDEQHEETDTGGE
jgi:hypothetical protein